jgi:hypothetical protein
MTITK